MLMSRYQLIAICGFLLACPAFAEDRPEPPHMSRVSSAPDRPAGRKHKAFRIDRKVLDSAEWKQAIERARTHQSGKGQYTLMRVLVDDAAAREQIQAQGTKLKEFTEQYHGGGGEYHVLSSGGFLLLQHINSARRRDGQDPVRVGAFTHGTTTLWVEVPPFGELGVVGDVILRRCPSEEMGALAIDVKTPAAVRETRLTIGPIVVGGPYGKTHTFDFNREYLLPLPPGSYKILLPDFDIRASRWDVVVEPKKVTRMTFGVSWQIEKTGESQAPFSPKEKSNTLPKLGPLGVGDPTKSVAP